MNSSHGLDDVMPFRLCCLESRQYGAEYCQKYLERRPMSASTNFDKVALGEALVDRPSNVYISITLNNYHKSVQKHYSY